VALAEVAWDVTVDIGESLTDLGRNAGRGVVDAVRAAIGLVLAVVLLLPFVALLAVLPFAVAVAANAFGAACTASVPPDDWKLRVYFAVTALLVTTLYGGACGMCGTGRRGRKVILYGLLAGAAIGLLRLPEPAVLNDMGAYLAAVIPWDRDWRI